MILSGIATILHFTHRGNLRPIFAEGALLCHAHAPCNNDIGDQGIKSRRSTTRVPVPPGGFVGDYMPFYYAWRSPMLYRKVREGLDQDDIVYFVAESTDVVAAGHNCVITDGNAGSYITNFYPAKLLEQVGEGIVDWKVMRSFMWTSTPEHGDRMRRRAAEFLVPERLPLELVSGIVVRTDSVDFAVRDLLARSGSTSIPTSTQSGWYYS